MKLQMMFLNELAGKVSLAHFSLLLMCCAIIGAGISYHLTLETRFASLEQKQEQVAVSIQDVQSQQETSTAAHADQFSKLTKQVDELKASVEPMVLVAKEQSQSLVDIRKQISGIETNYASELEKIKREDELVLASNAAIDNSNSQHNVTLIQDSAEAGSVRALPVLPINPPNSDFPSDESQPVKRASHQYPIAPRALPVNDPAEVSQSQTPDLPDYNLPIR